MKSDNTNKVQQLEKLIVQLTEIRSNIICMTSKLDEIIQSANDDDFIKIELFSQAIDSLQHHSELQEAFLQQMEHMYPNLKIENLKQAEHNLLDSKMQIIFCDEALGALRKFQLVYIKHEETMCLLAKYQENAIKISKISDLEELIRLCKPYKLFLELMEYNIEDITIEQEEIIENEFKKPIPKMLYAKKFLIAPLDNKVSLPNNENSIADDSVKEKVNLKYSYETKKDSKSFSVKSFRQEMQNPNGSFTIYLLYTLGWYRILSRKQFDKYLLPEDNQKINIDAALMLLLREGYLTEISSATEKLYCLSERGIQIFLRKESWDEFTKNDKKNQSKRDKPLLLTTIRDIYDNERLIDALVGLNEISLFIYNIELPKHDFVDITFYNKEIAREKLPFAEFLLKNRDNDMQINAQILIEDIYNTSGKQELINITAAADIVLLIINAEPDFASIKPIAYEKEFYYIKLDSDNEQLTLVREDGQTCGFDVIVNKIKPPAAGLSDEVSGSCLVDTEPDDIANDESPASVIETVNSPVDSNLKIREAVKPIVIDEKAQVHDFPQKSSDEITFADSMTLISKLLLEEKIMEAVVFAKTLSFISKPEFSTLYNRLLYATNMSVDSHKNNSEAIGALDNADANIVAQVSPQMLKLMKLSAFAWALLIPDSSHDYLLYNYKDGVIAEAEQDFNTVTPSLKKVFEILFELGSVSSVGFSNSIVSMFKAGREQQLANGRLMEQAKDLLKYTLPNMRSHLPGIPEMFEDCFGQSSELGKCMKIISEGDKTNRNYVENTFAKFEEKLLDSFNVSSEKIETYIDEVWDNVVVEKIAPHKKQKKLMERSIVRNSIFSNIKKRLEVMAEWLTITDSLFNNRIKNYERLASVRNRLITQFDAVCQEISQISLTSDIFLRAGLAVLKWSFTKMRDYLSNGTPYHGKWDYFGLLFSPYMSLDSEYKPALNKNLQSVTGFEPWRRMLGHISDEKRSLLEILDLIDDANEPNWFNNYRSAECINLYLLESEGREITDYSNAIEQAKADAKSELETLRSELEFAYIFGRIEESAKEYILRTSVDFSEYLINIKNFAQYRCFLSVLRNQIHEFSAAREKKLTANLERIKKTMTAIDPLVLEAINKNFAENNLIVAEEYLNRLEQGDTSLAKELKNELVNDAESDYHEKFIKQYNFFFDLCQNNLQENVLAKWAQRGIEQKISDFSKGQRNNSMSLLKSWPKRKGSPMLVSDVKNLLINFGFAVNKIIRQTHTGCELFDVTVAEKAKNLDDYPHPMARFGTQISEPVSVICLFGKTSSTPNALRGILIDDSLKLANSTFVLVDAAFSLNERRLVAELLKSEIRSMKSFIVIDRTLMLFLATLDKSKWLQALLKCTLPYTYCQPYVQGVGVVADEMFFGRKAELHNIRDYNGACLVYGGRQLGKTALLKRACSLMNNIPSKKYAFYIDVKKHNAEQTLTKICEVLMKSKLIDCHYNTTEKLCSTISAKLDKKEILEIQLYIDETDDFLEDISSHDYETLKPFKELKDNYPNRFKVVFAGLHKVAHNKNNSVIVHMGKPLCIKPFSTNDAKNLVERPLAHLGFRFQGSEGKKQLLLILASTNYYPGLLHLFCYKLVESISENYKGYYSAAKNNPPFVINEEHLRKVIFDSKLNEGIKEFFNATLALDFRYKLIANIIAYLDYCELDNDSTRPEGFHVDEIKQCGKISLLVNMGTDDFTILLEELEDMGILWKIPDTKYYRLRRTDFLEKIGSKDDTENLILEALERYGYDERKF